MINGIHRMVRELGDIIDNDTEGPLTIVGVMTGGEYIAKDLSRYLTERERETTTFNVRVDKEKGCVLDGKELIQNNGTTYVFVDDAIWTSRTKEIVGKAADEAGILYKYAVLLDPHKKADYSVHSD